MGDHTNLYFQLWYGVQHNWKNQQMRSYPCSQAIFLFHNRFIYKQGILNIFIKLINQQRFINAPYLSSNQYSLGKQKAIGIVKTFKYSEFKLLDVLHIEKRGLFMVKSYLVSIFICSYRMIVSACSHHHLSVGICIYKI